MEEEPVSKTETMEEEPVSKTEMMEEEPVSKTETMEEEPVSKADTMEEEPVSKTETMEEEPVSKADTMEEEPVSKTETMEEEPVSKAGKMEKEHYERVEEDYLFLSRHMMKNTKLFIKFLTEERPVMDEVTAEDILDEVSLFKRAQRMLDFVLQKKTEDVFKGLYLGCLHVHLWKAADVLMPENAPHEPEEEEDVVEHLPESWPSDSHFEMIKDPTKLILRGCGPKMKAMYQLCIKNDSEMYNMTRKDKGRLVIIDNEDFEKMPPRTGTNHDATGLTYLFSNLGFEVHQERNLKAVDMKEFLRVEAKKLEELSRCSCLIVAIMSYGYEGNSGVFGVDGVYENEDKETAQNYILMTDVKKWFTSLQPLANRPKVFLIVAQQLGDKYERSHNRTKHSASRYPDSKSLKLGSKELLHPAGSKKMHHEFPTFHCPNIEYPDPMKKLPRSLIQTPKIMLQQCRIGLDSEQTEIDGDEPNPTIPTDADIFQAIVTPREMLVFRDVSQGSWFIQAFIFVMANYGHQKHLREVFEKVNELSATQVQSEQKEEIAHCVANFTANKKLYFFPGILAEE